MKLFEKYKLGNVVLSNHIVMAPMTRCRAIGNVPNDLMVEYYSQRAEAGLIITEGTSPSLNGLGYTRQPGIFSEKQVEGWKKVADSVHDQGGRIFMQLMHTGRMSHPFNLPAGARMIAPSAIAVKGRKMNTDQAGPQEMPVPEEMTEEDIRVAIHEYITAGTNAIRAGFEGIELHGANGYLLEQFISPVSNQRTDLYGGSIENRCKFVLEVAEGVCNAIGKERTGIRISPYGISGDMRPYPELDATYKYLAEKFYELGMVYIHLVDHSSMGAPEVPLSIKQTIRKEFRNTLILSGGYDREQAETYLLSGFADLVAFGKPFISNPDLVERFKNNWPVNRNWDSSTFYTSGEKGYIDYPVFIDQ